MKSKILVANYVQFYYKHKEICIKYIKSSWIVLAHKERRKGQSEQEEKCLEAESKYLFCLKITGEELACHICISLVINTHIHITKKHLSHPACMNAASLVTPHAASHHTEAFSDFSQRLSTSEALVTPPQPERGSFKLKRVSWVLTVLPHLSRQAPNMWHIINIIFSGGVKTGRRTCKLLQETANVVAFCEIKQFHMQIWTVRWCGGCWVKSGCHLHLLLTIHAEMQKWMSSTFKGAVRCFFFFCTKLKWTAVFLLCICKH